MALVFQCGRCMSTEVNNIDDPETKEKMKAALQKSEQEAKEVAKVKREMYFSERI